MSVSAFVSQGSRNWSRELDDTIERWRLRHDIAVRFPDQDKIATAPKSFSSGNPVVLRMSLDQLSAYMAPISKEALLDLKMQIDTIRAAVVSKMQLEAAHKGYDNVVYNIWYARAAKVKRICGAYSQAIQLELKRRSEGEKSDRRKLGNDFSHHFICVAKEILPDDIFLAIKTEAFARTPGSNTYRGEDATD